MHLKMSSGKWRPFVTASMCYWCRRLKQLILIICCVTCFLTRILNHLRLKGHCSFETKCKILWLPYLIRARSKLVIQWGATVSGSGMSPCRMMTSLNGNICRVTGILYGEFTCPGEFPPKRPVTRSFDVFFDLCLNKEVSKQSRGWWSETQSSSLWRRCNGNKCWHIVNWTPEQNL